MHLTFFAALTILALTFTSTTLGIESTPSAETHPGAVEVGQALIAPNSSLYPLKKLKEKVELSLTFTTQGKVIRHLEFAQRRLREVNTLLKVQRQDLVSATLADYRFSIEQSLNHSTPDLKVTVGEALSRHLDVLQRIYDGVGSQQAKKAILQSIESVQNHHRSLLTTLDPTHQALLQQKIKVRASFACNFLARESTSSGNPQDVLDSLNNSLQLCQNMTR